MKTYQANGNTGLITVIENQVVIVCDVTSMDKVVRQFSYRCTIALYATGGTAYWIDSDSKMLITKGDLLIHNLERLKAEMLPEDNFGMIAVCVSSEFNRHFSQSVKISWKIRQGLVANSLFHLSLEDRRHVVENFEFLIMKCLSTEYPLRSAILEKLLNVLALDGLLRVEGYMSVSDYPTAMSPSTEKQDIWMGNATSSQLLFNRFTSLLEKIAVKNRSVAWWASQMNISPKYLSAVCREVGGKSARVMIAESVIQEAVRLLQNPNLTIKEISDKLGFVNQSHFGTFFKRHTGHSPIKAID